MNRSDIVLKGGYKYVLQTPYFCKTTIIPKENIHTPFISLFTDGLLLISPRYAWDGPSGPTIDDPLTIAASLPHDAGYQLIREGLLGIEYRGQFDMLLKQIMQEDAIQYKEPRKTISLLRAEYYFDGVDVFGGKFVHKNQPLITLKSYA